jgi:hypothetical protein
VAVLWLCCGSARSGIYIYIYIYYVLVLTPLKIFGGVQPMQSDFVSEIMNNFISCDKTLKTGFCAKCVLFSLLRFLFRLSRPKLSMSLHSNNGGGAATSAGSPVTWKVEFNLEVAGFDRIAARHNPYICCYQS